MSLVEDSTRAWAQTGYDPTWTLLGGSGSRNVHRVTAADKARFDYQSQKLIGQPSLWEVGDLMPRKGAFGGLKKAFSKLDDAILRPMFGSWTVLGLAFGGLVLPMLNISKVHKLGVGLTSYLGASYLPQGGLKDFFTGTLGGIGARWVASEIGRLKRSKELYDAFKVNRAASIMTDPSSLPQLTLQHGRDALHYLSPAADAFIELLI